MYKPSAVACVYHPHTKHSCLVER